jgi:DNA-binding transcriptional LysR family regulator
MVTRDLGAPALRLFALPLPLLGFRLRLYWYATANADPAHRWLCAQLVDATARALA